MDSDMQTPLSRLALGCYPLGGGYGQVHEEHARATVDAALDCGWTFLDTAEAYLESEARLGRILAGRRDRVFLATKAFPCEAFSLEHLSAALEGSLRRLRTDRVDLFQLHGPEGWVMPYGPTAVEELADSLERLRASGKALRIGVCNFGASELAELASRTEVFSMQNLYGILDPGGMDDTAHLPAVGRLLPYAQEHRIAFVAYSPLARGLLSDRIQASRSFPPDERHYLPRYQPGVYEHFVELARSLAAWAADHGRTLTQLAVAWTLQHPAVAATLIGAKSPEQVRAVAGSETWRLGEREFGEIGAIVSALPELAKQAEVTVWDHVDDERLAWLRSRRRSRDE